MKTMASIEHQQVEYARSSCEVEVNEECQYVSITDGETQFCFLTDWEYVEWQDCLESLAEETNIKDPKDLQYLLVYRNYLPH